MTSIILLAAGQSLHPWLAGVRGYAVYTTISPHNQQPYITRKYPDEKQLDAIIDAAAAAQKTWRAVPLEKRIEIGRRFMDEFKTPLSDRLPIELAMQMGRPIAQCAGEARGMLARAQYMLDIAASALADVSFANTGNSGDPFLKASADAPGFKRYIRREPLGVVLVVAPWNFPYLTAINSVLPALIAGNTVLLKPSPQTPLTAELLAQAWHAAVNALIPGFEDTLQVTHLPPTLVARAARSRKVDFVSFTGSVPGGKSVAAAAASYEGGEADGFKGVGLELGGKDPAYVRADAGLAYTAAELVDGAFFNSGQSCCSVERIYVHESVYDEFVERVKGVVESYVLGNPTDPKTNLGPVVSLASAERIRKQIADALAAGAKSIVPESLFPIAEVGTTYVAPTVLVDVDHSMDVMMEETFGPVVGIMKVPSDEAALALMNDSPYGLTASVWTNAEANEESARVFEELFATGLEAGTVFLNRCDFLDPALAWCGVKDSGRGVSLSKFGYDQLTRPKSVHMKIKTST